MIILVADTSALIDLERGNLLEVALSGHDRLVTPDLLFKRELEPYSSDAMVCMGLQILELSADELSSAQDLFNQNPALSLPDCAAYVCSHRPDHHLLTSDGNLRTYAERQGMNCHDGLWLLDRLHDSAVTTAEVLHAGLSLMAADSRCRLPPRKIDTRLRRWCR